MANRLAGSACAVIEINGSRDRFIRDLSFLFLFLLSLFSFDAIAQRCTIPRAASLQPSQRLPRGRLSAPEDNVNLDEEIRQSPKL